MPQLLTLYIAKRFAVMLALIVVSAGLLILVADYIEVLRRLAGDSEFAPWFGLKLAALRTPILLDEALPFAFLFTAMLSLLSLSRKLELVVARASGVSVWAFLRAPCTLAIILGVLATTLLNPLATTLKSRAENLQAEASPSQASGEGYWMRQADESGSSIIYATSTADYGRILFGVTAFRFDTAGKFREKISAARAELLPDHWLLNEASVISAAKPPHQLDSYELPTQVSAEELSRSVIEPQRVPVWGLPGFIESADRMGINPNRFRVAFHSLISRPVYLLAMLMIAAIVSLRFTRFGGTWRFLITGAAMGFLLYVLTDIARDIGSHGIISPALAGWLPPVVALTFGVTVLLHQEDG
jgi:lipopolysaccharide export system permease protein